MDKVTQTTEQESPPKTAQDYIEELVKQARSAAGRLAILSTAVKDQALLAMADGLEAKVEEILSSNEQDLDAVGKGKEQAALHWLQNVNVEGSDGLDAMYAAPNEELDMIRAGLKMAAGAPVTIQNAIDYLCIQVAEKYAESNTTKLYPNTEAWWVQEEPENMGALRYMQRVMRERLDVELSGVTREESA